MKAAQARASVEALKDVQNDKSLKTKAEKERRIRYSMCDFYIINFKTHFKLFRTYFSLGY